MFPSSSLLKDNFFGKWLQVPCGSGYEKVRAPTLVAGLTSCAEPWICASESGGSLLFMPVTTGVDKVTGARGRAGLCWHSWHSWRGSDDDS